MKVVYEEFTSIGEYLDIIGKRKPNSVFCDAKMASHIGDREFTMTDSYEESVELAVKGYKDGLDQMMATSSKIIHRENTSRAMPSIGVVGYAPHVPNAITGVPMSMISTTPIKAKAKVITILYNMGDSCEVSTRRFVTAGKHLLNTIVTLETQGYRVGLNILNAHCKSNEYAVNSVQIKHWKQPSNPLKMAYPLIHPSYIRRQSFRWLETVPSLTNSGFPYGYGGPLWHYIESGGASARADWLRQNGILKRNWFYYIEFRSAEHMDADEIINYWGLTAQRKIA